MPDSEVTATVDTVSPAPSWPPVRHPFQVMAFVVFVILGGGWMLGDSSRAMVQYLGTWAVVWDTTLIILALSGVIAAVTARRDEALSLLLERIALMGTGLFSFMYALAISVNNISAWPWVTASIFGLLMPIACGWRFSQVQKRIAWLRLVASVTGAA